MNSFSYYRVFRAIEHLPGASITIYEFCPVHKKNSVVSRFKKSTIFLFAFLERLFVLCPKCYIFIGEDLCAVFHHHGPELNYFIAFILASDCKYPKRGLSGISNRIGFPNSFDFASIFLVRISFLEPCPLVGQVLKCVAEHLSKFGIEIMKSPVTSHYGQSERRILS